ncbi:Kinesin light chain [Fusarium albosuccineum]|uniref:Kinesin light chain n=1 Tax=Fusarium albosuccineum TaxID=1237068 RepID=A0A8H4PF95_9HYPO|nr:Kinesin light chain [Fusarium albosuccineum]
MTAASFLGIFMDTNINLLEILNESCELRDRIDEEFHALQESRKIRTDCFWEALPSKRGGIIVPKESATLGGDRGRAIHADHSNMVKFSSPTDEGYKAVRSTLKEMIDVAARAPHKSQLELPRRSAATTTGTANKPPAWFISISRNQFFSGRESELDKLNSCLGLYTLEHGKSHTRAAIWGVGGVGKTQIAMQWVTSIHERNNISVFWVHGGSIDRFVDSYTKIARCCKVPGCDVDDPQLSQHDILHKVKEWLESEAQRWPWVMVVDNVDDINVFRQTKNVGTSQITIESFLPCPVHGSIVFTTRNKETASVLADPVNLVMVDEMTSRDCVELMRTRSPLDKHVDKDLRELATELGYLPLALIQSTTYLAKKEDSVAEYLQKLKQVRRLVPEQPPEDETSVLRDEEGRYSAVARTLMVTFEAIESENGLAMELLRLAGFYERQEVSRSLFINFAERYELCSIGIFVLGPEWDGWEATGRVTCPTSEEVNEALSLLESYSVLTKGRDEGAVTMHRLVHLVLRNQTKGNRSLAREIAAKAMTTMC